MIRPHAGHIFGITAFLILPVALFMPKGLAVLFVLAALALFGIMLANVSARPRIIVDAAKWVVALVVLAAVSASWAPHPGETLVTLAALSLTFLGGFILFFAARALSTQERQFAEAAILWGGIAGFSLLGFELVGNAKLTLALRHLIGKNDGTLIFPVDLFNNGATVAALYLWPWSVAIWRRWKLASLCLLVPASACFLLVREDASLAALVIALPVAALVSFAPRLGPKAFMLLVAAAIAAAPLFPNVMMSAVETDDRPRFVSNSGYHRLVIWQTTVARLKERPVLGFGFDASRTLYDKTQKVKIVKYDKNGEIWWGSDFEPIPLHPHNGVLQVWLELGAAGAMLLLGFMVVVIRSAATVKGRVTRAATFGGMTSALMIVSISYGVWQSWWQASLWLCAALIAVVVTTLPPDPTSGDRRE